MKRNEQIEAHAPLVERIARQLLVRLGPNVPLDDLLSAGYIGLLEAIDRYDPNRKVEFAAYARPRIHGAMIDSLYELDMLPRSMRAKIEETREFEHQFLQIHGQRPSLEDIANGTGRSIEEIQENQNYARQSDFVRLDEPIIRQQGATTLLDHFIDKESLSGDEILELNAARTILREAFDGLPKRTRLIIAFYYVEELTMREIAEIMSVTIGRISQLHTEAVQHFQAVLKTSPNIDHERVIKLFLGSVHVDS